MCTGFCLFDIYHDPCETTNIVDNPENKDIFENLKMKLSDFYRQIVPQTNRPIDPRSDPKKFNNTWWTWLDEQPKDSSGAFFIRIKNNICQRLKIFYLIRLLGIC